MPKGNPLRHAASAAGIALLLALAALPFCTGPYAMFVAAQMIASAYIAMAIDLSHSFGRVLSFCTGSFFALGAYAAYYLGTMFSGEVLLILPAAVLLTALFGALVALMVTRMRGAHSAVVATLAIGTIIVLIANALSDQTGGEDGLTFRVPLSLLGFPVAVGVNNATYFLALVPVALYLLTYRALYATPFGTVMRAVGENDTRSEQLGFNVGLRRVVIFAAAAGLSALGGALYCILVGHISTALFEPLLSLNGVLWATVGGLGSPFGALIGTAIIYPSVELAAGLIQSVEAVVGVLLIVSALWFPRGVAGAIDGLSVHVIPWKRRASRAPAGRDPVITETAADL